jgi:hypothetical protein
LAHTATWVRGGKLEAVLEHLVKTLRIKVPIPSLPYVLMVSYLQTEITLPSPLSLSRGKCKENKICINVE